MKSLTIPTHFAKHLRQVFFGGNWTEVNLKDTLSDVKLEQAVAQKGGHNSIAALTFHIHYFVAAQLKVLEGGPLDAHDKYSYDLPPLHSEEDWEKMKANVWADVERWAALVQQLPEERLWESFVDEKYGTWFQNLQGLIEHTHYHLGQIVIIKKYLTKL
jgi:uncharacterized damage-inducible protein DinB